MLDLRLTSIAFSGICSGAILGIFIPSVKETKNRRGSLDLEQSTPSSLGKLLLFGLLKLLLVSAGFAAVGIGTLTLFGVYPIGQPYDNRVLVSAVLAGAVLGKVARYIFWTRYAMWK